MVSSWRTEDEAGEAHRKDIMGGLELKIGSVDFILKTVVSHWRIKAEGYLVRPALGGKSLWFLKWRPGQGKGWGRPRRHSIAFIQLSLRTLDSMNHSLLLESPSLALKTPFYLCFLPTLTVPVQLPLPTFPPFSLKYDCSSRLLSLASSLFTFHSLPWQSLLSPKNQI